MRFKSGNFIVLLCLLSFFDASAQSFDWKAGYLGFFDNREYDNVYAFDQTMFGSRISAEAGALIDGNNRLAVGLDYLYEFGSKGELKAPDMILYFNGSHNKINYAFGAIPRYGKIDMPLALLTDTLNYYRPEIEGIYLGYEGSAFKQNLWIDWTGRRSQVTRESFTIGLSGRLDKGLFVYRHHLVINHLAHTLPKDPNASLRDNMGFSVMAGVNLSSLTGLDTLTITAGLLGSYDRLRGVYDPKTMSGFLGEIEAQYKGFGIHSVLYTGEGQCITSGDKSYTADFYSRSDIYYKIKKNSLESRFQFSWQMLPDNITELSFLFVARINLGGIFRHKTTE